jgi:plastocyanin
MNLKARFSFLVFAIIGVFALAACGGGGGGGAASATQTVTPDGESLAYAQKTMTVPAGQQVTVTFNNTSGQSHNWVLVNGGDDVVARVDEAGIAAGPPNYLTPGSDVLANTEMLSGGGSGTVTFTVSAGTYTYICTYPGHYAGGMKGTLTAQ